VKEVYNKVYLMLLRHFFL